MLGRRLELAIGFIRRFLFIECWFREQAANPNIVPIFSQTCVSSGRLLTNIPCLCWDQRNFEPKYASRSGGLICADWRACPISLTYTGLEDPVSCVILGKHQPAWEAADEPRRATLESPTVLTDVGVDLKLYSSPLALRFSHGRQGLRGTERSGNCAQPSRMFNDSVFCSSFTMICTEILSRCWPEVHPGVCAEAAVHPGAASVTSLHCCFLTRRRRVVITKRCKHLSRV